MSTDQGPATGRFRVGVQLHPQHATMAELRAAWEAFDALEADGLRVASLWTWDHFYPLTGDPEGPHFEGWTTLAAMAATTSSATVGMLVTGMGYRNPDLLADMARTLDHLSGGRAVLGLGAGWARRDYDEYGYPFGSIADRVALFREALPRIRARLDRLTPPPLQRPLPILVGTGGERVMLRLVAEHAQGWNAIAGPDAFRHKSGVLDEWCARVGRDPAEIERTVMWAPDRNGPADLDAYLDAGAQHLIVGMDPPFDPAPVRDLLVRSAA
jgi:probable F420-dependent oxidoreductase